MRLKRYLLTLATLSLLHTAAYADIFVTLTAPNTCRNLPGNWSGEGEIEALNGLVNCTYLGQGMITAGSTPSSFLMHVEMTPKNNSGNCPPPKPINLTGTCSSDGNIVLHSDNVDLSGTVNDAATLAHLKGVVLVEVNVPVFGTKTVSATVKDLRLNKV